MIQNSFNNKLTKISSGASENNAAEPLVVFDKIVKSYYQATNGRGVIKIDCCDLDCEGIFDYLESFAESDPANKMILEVTVSNQAFIMDVAEKLRPLSGLFIIEPANLSILAADDKELLLSAIA